MAADLTPARPWRTGLLVLLVLVGVTAVAVLVTPWVYRALVDLGLLPPGKYAKLLRRVVLLPLIVIFLVTCRPWRDGGLATYGLVGPQARLRPPLVGYLLTMAVIGLFVAWHFAAGWLHLEDPMKPGEIVRRYARWFVTGWGIALIEEWFFRGWLDRKLRLGYRPLVAALVVGVLYGLIHVFQGRPPGADVTPDVAGGLEAIQRWLARFGDLEDFLPLFVGLTLFSLVLTALWHRTRTLWTAVAIHAASIFMLKTYGSWTDRWTDTWPWRNWAGSKHLLDGPPGWILLAGLAFWLWRPLGGRGRRS
ncbi:MAG: lysostaphin resistance A-like protein [Planctomycetota bacterium]